MSLHSARVQPDRPRPSGPHGRLPFIGRETQLAMLREVLRTAERGDGSITLIAGDSGVGKTRLVEVLVEEARAARWAVASGVAYDVESGSPYGLIADALTPFVREMDPGSLTVAARGTEADLAHILPVLARSGRVDTTRGDPDARARLLWYFTQFLRRAASRSPLLVTLDNLQWADDSSLALLHFLSRQVGGARLAVIATYHPGGTPAESKPRRVVHSLVTAGTARLMTLGPLGEEETVDLVRRAFDTEGRAVERFARRLHARTGGSPFFSQEVLKSLVEHGELRQAGGEWTRWNADVTRLPASVRETVEIRLGALSEPAQRVASILATVGTPASIALLRRLCAIPLDGLAPVMEELVDRGILREVPREDQSCYDFVHPMVRSALYGALGSARAKSYHVLVVAGLEELYGESVLQHATELAPHLERASDLVENDRATEYFMAAGSEALARHADREADRFLSQALGLVERSPGGKYGDALPALLALLARARQRIGDHGAALDLLTRARDLARARGEGAAEAALERRAGLVCMAAGRPGDAMPHLEAAEHLAMRVGVPDVAVRSRVARGMALHSIGRSAEAIELVRGTLPLADTLGEAGLKARVHRAMVLMLGWTGPADEARRHGAAAIEAASVSGDNGVAWSVHWALAILAGFTGDSAGVRRHQQEAEALAEAIGSPVLRAWSAEIGIEYAAAAGTWKEALEKSEEAIPIARSVAPRTLLPRLLVWTAIILLERGEVDRAKAMLDEAWAQSGAGGDVQGRDVHAVIPALLGMAEYHLKRNEYDRAAELGERALAIADRMGYVAWAIHRLLPVLCEVRLWQADYERAGEIARRLRAQSEPLGHRLGLAWADAADALIPRLRDNDSRAIARLLEAAERIEAVPFVFHGARIRRNAALLLAADNLRDDALRELRLAHEVFLSLGAAHELNRTREQMRELGARPPQTTIVSGGELTAREEQIARLVARRKSNKEIAAALGISARTVGTHLSNIFVKLGLDSRGALADHVRGVDTAKDPT